MYIQLKPTSIWQFSVSYTLWVGMCLYPIQPRITVILHELNHFFVLMLPIQLEIIENFQIQHKA
jgi:hypothetical protein